MQSITWFYRYTNQLKGPCTKDAVIQMAGDLQIENVIYEAEIARLELDAIPRKILDFDILLDRQSKYNFEKSEKASAAAKNPKDKPLSIKLSGKKFNYCDLQGKCMGPFEFSELVAALKIVGTYEGILIKEEKDASWTSIFEWSELIGPLNIQKRTSARVTITGIVEVLSLAAAKPLELVDISENGFSCIYNGAVLTDRFQARLISPWLNQPILCQVQPVNTRDYLMGFKFLRLKDEDRKMIADHIARKKEQMVILLPKAG